MHQTVLLGLAGIIVLGLGARWVASRLRVPPVLLTLGAGLAAGPGIEYLHRHPPDALAGDTFELLGALDPEQLFSGLFAPLVSMAVALIVLDAALRLRGAAPERAGRRLVFAGGLIGCLLTGAAAVFLLDVTIPFALLLGAVFLPVGTADAAPSGRVGAIHRWESAASGPLGIALALPVFAVVLATGSDAPVVRSVAGVVKTILLGGAFGVACALLLSLVLRFRFAPDRLQTTVAMMFFTFAFAWSSYGQPEAGLFAAATMGVVLAKQRLADVSRVRAGVDALCVLLTPCLLVALGARISLETFERADRSGVVFVALLVLVVRPMGVFLSTLGGGLSRRQKTLLCGLAPRDVLPLSIVSVFVLRLEEEGVLPATGVGIFAQADTLIVVTLLVVLVTVLVGWLTSAFARDPATELLARPVTMNSSRSEKADRRTPLDEHGTGGDAGER